MASQTQADRPPVLKNLITITAGITSGICSKLVEYPFDTIKVKLQTQGSNNLPNAYTSTWDCVSKVYHQEGVRGLFRGVTAPVIGACAELGVTFWSYGFSLDMLQVYYDLRGQGMVLNREELKWNEVAFAGACGGFFTSLLLTPVELMKCKMQVQYNRLAAMSMGAAEQGVVYRNIWHCLYHTVKTGGLTGVYRGHVSTIAREIPGNMMWFLNYEMVKLAIKDVIAYELLVSMIAGAAAGIGYWTIGMPADRVKSILQTEVNQRNKIGEVVKQVIRQEGLKGFYRGYLPTVLRAMPSNAVIFSVYELTLKLFDRILD